jgi:hypothetical protein
MWRMLQQPEPKDYVIATNTLNSIRDLCRIAFAHVGLNWEDHVVSDPAFRRPTEITASRGDYARAKRDLGWEPRTFFEDLVKRMVEEDLERLGGYDTSVELEDLDLYLRIALDSRILYLGPPPFARYRWHGAQTGNDKLTRGQIAVCRKHLALLTARGDVQVDARTNTLIIRDLADRLPDGRVAAHHGSLSRRARLEAEARLKEGQPRALVSTSSLELGIDVGAIDLVVQLQSTRNVAAALQRVGRAGHLLSRVSRGRFVVTKGDELMEAAAIVRAIRDR